MLVFILCSHNVLWVPHCISIILICRLDDQNIGLVSTEAFTQLISSRDLGLQLNENELFYIAEQVDPGNGWIPFMSVAQQLPNFLVSLYNQRAELQVVHNIPLLRCCYTKYMPYCMASQT